MMFDCVRTWNIYILIKVVGCQACFWLSLAAITASDHRSTEQPKNIFQVRQVMNSLQKWPQVSLDSAATFNASLSLSARCRAFQKGEPNRNTISSARITLTRTLHVCARELCVFFLMTFLSSISFSILWMCVCDFGRFIFSKCNWCKWSLGRLAINWWPTLWVNTEAAHVPNAEDVICFVHFTSWLIYDWFWLKRNRIIWCVLCALHCIVWKLFIERACKKWMFFI